MMTSLADSCVAETLSDLNMFYIRQIGASLKKHVGLQEQLEKEIKIRDGAVRLISACTQETQFLEIAKTLHASNTRTLSYMTKLQKLKENEMVDDIMDEFGSTNQSRICKGRIAISDIRIPLVWRDFYPSPKSKDQNRHAVFCLITVDSDVQEGSLICVDKSTTDISFHDTIIFENASFDFKLNIDVFALPLSNKSVANPNSQKLISRFNRSGSKTEGKKLRDYLKENARKGFKSPPLFENIASVELSLAHISDAVKSHDLQVTNVNHLSLPIYGNVSCRLVAQPSCVTNVSISGYINKLESTRKCPNWNRVWCEAKAGLLNGWNDELKEKLKFTIDLFAQGVKVNEIQKFRQVRSNSFEIIHEKDRHIFSAKDNAEMSKWIRELRYHKNDIEAWGSSCMIEPSQRLPLHIRPPSSRRPSQDLIFDPSLRNTLLYNRLGEESRRNSTDNSSDFSCANRMNHESRRNSDTSISTILEKKKYTYMEVNGDFTSNILSNEQFQKLPSGVNSVRKKKRAPTCPKEELRLIRNKPDKPPLPKAPPPAQKLKFRKRGSSSSGSSLDGILEEKIGECHVNSPKPKPRMQHSYEYIQPENFQDVIKTGEYSSYESLNTHRSSQSSGYRSELEIEDRKLIDPLTMNIKHPSDFFTDKSSDILRNKRAFGFERTRSLDTEDFSRVSKNSNYEVSSIASSSGERIYDEPPLEYRPRTNTIPQASPKNFHRIKPQSAPIRQANLLKPVPTPRKTKIQKSFSSSDENHIYDLPDDREDENKLSRIQNFQRFPSVLDKPFQKQERICVDDESNLTSYKSKVHSSKAFPAYATVKKDQASV